MGAKRAHIITRAYIQEWADDRNNVEVADLARGKVLRTSINNATVVANAYETELMGIDLEAAFSQTESEGLSALRAVRKRSSCSDVKMKSMIRFLDMHRIRGRYANHAKTRTQAVVVKSDGSSEETRFSSGDHMVLRRSAEPSELEELELEKWSWTIWNVPEAITGDSAVLLWRAHGSTRATTVTFPLSPTEMLVVGEAISPLVDVNHVIAAKSRRWLVARPGSFKKDVVESVGRNRTIPDDSWLHLRRAGLDVW